MEAELKHYYFHPALAWFFVVVTLGILGYNIYPNASYGWALFLGMGSVIMLGTRYRTWVSIDEKIILDEFYFAFLRTKSEKIRFDKLNRITIHKERTTYKAAQRSRDRTADFNTFSATLEYDEEKSYPLTSSSYWESFKEELDEFSAKLNLPVVKVY